MLNEIACPNCRRRLRLREGAFVREVKCPSCLTQFMAPLPEEAPQLLDPLDPSTKPDAIATASMTPPALPDTIRSPHDEFSPHIELMESPERNTDSQSNEPWGRVWLVGILLACGLIFPLAFFLANWEYGRQGQRPPVKPEEHRDDIANVRRDEVKLPEDEITRELRAFFGQFDKAVAARRGEDIAAHFDIDRLFEELVTMGVVPDEMLRRRASSVQSIRAGFLQTFTNPAGFVSWERSELRQVKVLRGGEAEVIARHFAADGSRLIIRWWLIRSSGRWRVYDMEDLSINLRSSAVMAGTLDGGIKNVNRVAKAVNTLREVMVQFSGQPDLNLVERKLKIAATVDLLPENLQALRHYAEGLTHSHRGRHEQALKSLDEAGRLKPDMPALSRTRGSVYSKLGRWEDAVPHLQAYRDLLGDDPQVLNELGMAFRHLNRYVEAAALYRKSLDMDPHDVESYAGLTYSLTSDDNLSDLRKRFAVIKKKKTIFDVLAPGLLKSQQDEVLEQVSLAMKEADSREPAVDYYLALAQARMGKSEEAVRSFKAALPREKDEKKRKEFVRQFLEGMAESNRLAEGYRAAPDKQEACRLFADTARASSNYETWKRLLDLHGREYPDDLLLLLHLAEQHVREGRYKQANDTLARIKRVPPEIEDLFVSTSIQTRYFMGMGLTAYEELGARRQTFRQLAKLCLDDQNYAQLHALIAAHARKVPGDDALYEYRLRLHIRQGRFAEASALLRDGLPQMIEDEYKPRLRTAFLSEMRAAGKVIEAYDAIPDKRYAFNTLMHYDETAGERPLPDPDRLIAHHRAKTPEDYSLLYWEGVCAHDRGNWERAIECLAEYGKRRRGELGEFARWRYTNALYRTVGASRAYERSYDKAKDYVQLVNLLVKDKKGDDLEALIALVKSSWPLAEQDPEVVFHSALASAYRKRPEEALTRFKEAYRKQPDELRRREITLHFAQSMASIRHGLKAYRALADKNIMFRTLARSYVADNETDELMALLEEHGRTNGGTLPHAYYMSQLCLLRNQPEEAMKLIAEAFPRVSPIDSLGVREGLYRAAIQCGKVVQAYRELGPTRENFEKAAFLCRQESDAKQLERLILAHREVDADDPRLIVEEGEVLWLNKEYEKLLKHLSRHEKDAFAQRKHQGTMIDRRVRCLVRLKRLGEAAKEVVKLSATDEAVVVLRMLVEAAQGKEKGTISILDNVYVATPILSKCYHDVDLGPLLRGESFKAFRIKFPEPRDEIKDEK